MEELRRAIWFGIGAALLALIWFFGIGWRGRIWDQPMEVAVDGGLPLIFGFNVDDLLLTFFIIAGATICYALCLRALHRGFPRALTAVVLATALACAALIPSSLLTTPDAAHLAADVRTLWLHGRYPTSFDNVPAKVHEETGDPVAGRVIDYRNNPSGYGPVAYIVGGAPIPFVGDGMRANIVGQKVVASIALVLTALFAGLAARRLGYNPGFVAGFIGLNPLMLWEYAGNGHNDSLMAAFAMAGLVLILTTSWPKRIGGVALQGAAVLTKFAIAPAGVLLAVYWFPKLRLFAAAAAFLAGVAFITLILTNNLNIATAGPAGALTFTPWRILYDAFSGPGADTDPYIALGYAVFVAIAVYLILSERLKTEQELVGATACMLFFLLFFSASYLPWYQIWYLPFAALSGRRWLMAGTLTFSIGAFLVILAQNWNAVIIIDMGIDEPMNYSVVTLWLAVGAALAGTWWYDRERARAAAVTAPRTRRQQLRPAKRRR